jgi:hypothetical protein
VEEVRFRLGAEEWVGPNGVDTDRPVGVNSGGPCRHLPKDPTVTLQSQREQK